MTLTDLHSHSKFSADGKSQLVDMVNTAKSKGLRYYGVSEHFDLDEQTIKLYGKIDEKAYFARARELQRQLNDDNFTFLAGGEFNYVSDERVLDKFLAMVERVRPDYVINSVHIADGKELFRREYFEGKSKQYAYSLYLEQVLKSLDVPFKFDIVGHIGYPSRYLPYEDKSIRYADFADLYEAILTKIIHMGVILEVNSSTKGALSEFLPFQDVLARYYELGGRKVSFGSDAHYTSRIADKRAQAVELLKSIGFTYITVPNKGKDEIQVEL